MTRNVFHALNLSLCPWRQMSAEKTSAEKLLQYTFYNPHAQLECTMLYIFYRIELYVVIRGCKVRTISTHLFLHLVKIIPYNANVSENNLQNFTKTYYLVLFLQRSYKHKEIFPRSDWTRTSVYCQNVATIATKNILFKYIKFWLEIRK